MKIVAKLLSFLFVLCFLFNISITNDSFTLARSSSFEYINEKKNTLDSIKSKVVFEGFSNISAESNLEIAKEINKKNTFTKLRIHLNNSFKDSIQRPTKDIPINEAKKLLEEQRSRVKKYYTQTNNEYVKELRLENLDVNYYVDEYAPFIIAEFNSEIKEKDIKYIYEISKLDLIKTIYVKNEVRPEKELNSAISAVNATNIISNSTTNGSGIVIGILDTGIIDINNSNFNNISATAQNLWYYNETVSEHATMVASVAIGMAPAASILSVEVSGSPNGEIGWLLDNGVNVVNMSFGYDNSNEYGKYTSESAYIDSIAHDNWVTFVGSAGNRGKEADAYVTPPNGYNMLTIGSCSDNGEWSSFSSYEEQFNIAFPNIVAPGEYLSIPTFSSLYSGTSLSAPLVTGAIAVLMQKSSLLIMYPERVISVIMASTQRIPSYAVSSGFNDKVGTGMLNLNNAMSALNTTNAFSVETDRIGSYVSARNVYLEKGQRIRVAFVSFVNNNGRANTSLVTDYDLFLFDANENMVAHNSGTHNNEFIDYVATFSGNYTIKVKQFSAKKTEDIDWCSYTYFIN